MALARYHLRRAFFGFSKSFNNNSPRATSDFCHSQTLLPSSISYQKRHAGFNASPSVDKYQGIVKDFEVSKDPQEWQFVERLLPVVTVPKPPEEGIFPSGWRPQNPELYEKLPYFVRRTKSHMVPVYMDALARGDKKVTLIRYVCGDIFTLAEDVDRYLKEKHGRVFAVQVNEFTGVIKIRGDYALDTKAFLLSVGL